jgi:glycogen(starch) synthase
VRNDVALVASSFAPHSGGVETHEQHVARDLRARGHEVVVWTVDRGEHLGHGVVDGVEVRYLPTPLPARGVGAVLRFLLRLPSAVLAWGRAYRDARPALLHVQCFGPNGLYAVALARFTGAHLVVSSHGETFADDHAVFDESALLRGGLRVAISRADRVTGCSTVVLDDLRARFGAGDAVVVPNGVDMDATPTRGDQRDRHIGPPVVLAVGRIEWVKGFDLLVRAFAAADLPAGSRLVLAGEGEQLPALRDLAVRLGVADRVAFPGRLTAQEVTHAMSGASVVVVPSRREAFGIVVLEAWRSGAPLVVTTRGGPATLVRHEVDGLMVDPEDTEGLADAITSVVTDTRLAERLSDAGRSSVERYTWTRVAEAYEEIYDQVAVGTRNS